MELGNDFVLKKEVQEFSIEDHGAQKRAMLCIDVDSLSNGIVAKITPNHFALFMVLVSHMDGEQKSFPSIETLQKELGCSKQKVLDGLRHLKGLTVNGEPLISVEKETGGKGWQKNVYKLNFPEIKECVHDKKGFMSSEKIVMCFKKAYEETYQQPYMGKDELVRISDKIQGKVDDELTTEIVEFAVSNYNTHWATKGYPRPTLGMLAEWLFNQANEKVTEEKEKQQQYEQRIAEAEKVEQIDSAAMLDL